MKTVAYLRLSTGSQDLTNQKLAVLDYARQKHLTLDRFVEAQASSRKGRDPRRIEELLGMLAEGDRLVVSELSRLGLHRPDRGHLPDRPPPFHPDPKARADGLKWPIAGAASLEHIFTAIWALPYILEYALRGIFEGWCKKLGHRNYAG